jgi:mannose-6-phosphate isomerase-like protein (cupin superfamily)
LINHSEVKYTKEFTMPIITPQEAKEFELHGAKFTGLAAPSRGSKENAVWILTLPPNSIPVPHSLTREEIIVGIEGLAEAKIDGKSFEIVPDSALVVPSGSCFQLRTPTSTGFRGVVVFPVGGSALLEGKPSRQIKRPGTAHVISLL